MGEFEGVCVNWKKEKKNTEKRCVGVLDTYYWVYYNAWLPLRISKQGTQRLELIVIYSAVCA